MAFMLRFSSSVIANTLAYQRELTLKKQNQALLLMARNLFSQLSNLSTLLKEIMNEARSLTNAERWVGGASPMLKGGWVGGASPMLKGGWVEPHQC